MFNFKKLLSLLTVLVLSCGVICFAGCKTENIPTNSIDLNPSHSNITNIQDKGISLTRKNSVIINDSNGKYLQETLTANITADISTDKTLVWRANWVDSSVTENINEYLKVEPLQADGNVAYVKCYKNFEEFGSIVITVSSKVAPNVMASCVANYVGIPTSLDVLDGSLLISGTTVNINLGETYLYNLNLGHVLGVGSEYGEYNVTFTNITGTVDLTCELWGTDGKAGESTITDIDINNSSDIINVNIPTSYGNHEDTVYLSNFRNASYYLVPLITSDKNLSIMCKPVYNGQYGNEYYGGATVPRGGIKAYTTNCNLTITAKITEVKSNISVTVDFNIGG